MSANQTPDEIEICSRLARLGVDSRTRELANARVRIFADAIEDGMESGAARARAEAAEVRLRTMLAAFDLVTGRALPAR